MAEVRSCCGALMRESEMSIHQQPGRVTPPGQNGALEEEYLLFSLLEGEEIGELR